MHLKPLIDSKYKKHLTLAELTDEKITECYLKLSVMTFISIYVSCNAHPSPKPQ